MRSLILGTGNSVRLFCAMPCHFPWALLRFTYLFFTCICRCLWSSTEKHLCKPKGHILLQLGLSPSSHPHSVIISCSHSSFTFSPFLLGLCLSGKLSVEGQCLTPFAARTGGSDRCSQHCPFSPPHPLVPCVSGSPLCTLS